MKMYLLMKHTIRENYRYLLTILLAYGFLGIIYHITNNLMVKVYLIQTTAFALTLVNALLLPSLLYKNYYSSTNSNHVASIPMKRIEVFFSLYLAGFGLSIAMILGYSCLTELLSNSVDAFIGYSSALLVGFTYYYHISLLAFWICGHGLFQAVVTLVMIFGPYFGFMVYQWALEMYDSTYLFTYTTETIMNLLPVVGCVSYWLEYDPTQVYGLYLNLSFLFLILTVIVVRYRRYERTGQSMVFHSLSYVVRGIIILLGSACLYAVFGSILGQREYVAQLMTCMILSIMVAYVVEMIYKKKIKVFYSILTGGLSAIVIFSSITFGVRAMDSYVPSNYDHIVIKVNDYSYHVNNGEVVIDDPQIFEKVMEMNEEFLASHINGYNLQGNVVVEYCGDDGEPFFARQYNLTCDMMEKIYNDSEYKEILFDALTKEERTLLELAQKHQPITFIAGYNGDEYPKYIVDTEAEYYLFENYLKQELEAYKNGERTIEIEEESLEYTYFTYEYMNEDGDIVSYWIYSELLYNALSKTFDF